MRNIAPWTPEGHLLIKIVKQQFSTIIRNKTEQSNNEKQLLGLKKDLLFNLVVRRKVKQNIGR